LAKLEAIARNQNPLDRNRALLAYIDQLGPGDFEEAVAQFRGFGMTAENPSGDYALLLSAWAKADPLSALSYAEENTGSRFAANTSLTSWASIDPEAAIRWAQSSHEGEGANPYFASIIRGLAGSDLTRATQLLTGMPESAERSEALNGLLPQLLEQGGEATRAWIDGIADEGLKNGAMTSAIMGLADIDPDGTHAWLIANPLEDSQKFMYWVFNKWSMKDQQSAMTALNTLPSGKSRSNALSGVIQSVAARDPNAALSLIERYDADVSEGVLQNFVWFAMANDPSLAVTKISSVKDERAREQMYFQAMDLWLGRDPSAANAWVRSNPVPRSVQDYMDRRQKERQRR
jgi:hypothetical protein